MAQSRMWTDSQGFVTVTRADGTSFRANPLNIGVESELYTRFLEDDTKDTSIEEWFAKTIDGPATSVIEHLLDPSNITRERFSGNPEKVKTVKAVGFRVNPYVDRIKLPPAIRLSISQYVAALLVRHPRYLLKLVEFHSRTTGEDGLARNLALSNMLELFNTYVERIQRSVFILTRRADSAEYLYADGGLVVEEPWRREFGIPFDIHTPLTPDIALQVLPVPLQFKDDLSTVAIMEATNQGVTRHNRIILGGASRFLFSRQKVPTAFISANIGKSAPKNIGYRVINGRLETSFHPERT